VRGVIRLLTLTLSTHRAVYFTTIVTANYISTLNMPISVNFVMPTITSYCSVIMSNSY